MLASITAVNCRKRAKPVCNVRGYDTLLILSCRSFTNCDQPIAAHRLVQNRKETERCQPKRRKPSSRSAHRWMICARFLLADPYGVEFDGKDLAATTHLLARNPDTKDPLATMRIRFLYGTLVAWERLAVAANGPPRLLFSMVNAARRYSQASAVLDKTGRHLS